MRRKACCGASRVITTGAEGDVRKSVYSLNKMHSPRTNAWKQEVEQLPRHEGHEEKQDASFPRSGAHRYTQVSELHRHSCRDDVL